jgi:ketosteroid isomerase-like protein
MKILQNIIFISLISTLGWAQNQDRKAILDVLDKQVLAWNSGNIPAFMEGYHNSDSLSFIGANGPTYGWQNTLNNYKKRYPDLATMGQLKFDLLKIQVFEGRTAHVVGKWHLTRPEKGNVGGFYSLVFRKIKGKWLIISDHTS